MSEYSPEEKQEMLDIDKNEAKFAGLIGGMAGGLGGASIVLKANQTTEAQTTTCNNSEHLGEVESVGVVGGLAIAGAVVVGSLFYAGRRQVRKWLDQA